MNVDAACECGAYFRVDTEDASEYSDAAWFTFLRFATAHEPCGYMVSPGNGDDDEEDNDEETHSTFVLGPMDLPPTDGNPTYPPPYLSG